MKNLLKALLPAIVLALGAGEAFGQLAWTRDTRNPVLSGGASGAWNYYVGMPGVLFNTDSSRYEMWFVGFAGVPGINGDYRPYSIGFASSKDGINWAMYPTPVLSPTPGTWDAYTIEAPMVIRQNGQYKMWYNSYLSPTSPGYLGYATSSDGIHWTKYSGNPVMGPGKSAWEAGGPASCDVIPFPGGYKLWYTGLDATFLKGNIGYATSADGIVWVRDTVSNPVLKSGASGQWDDGLVATPQVLQFGNTCLMYYTGFRTSTSPRAAGVATSNDTGKTWTRYSGNPVLVPSGTGWDGTWIEVGTVLQRGDTLDMWYDGDVSPVSTNRYRIGHATSRLSQWVALVSPANGGQISSDSCHLLWHKPTILAQRYHVQVALDSVFATIVVDDTALTDTSRWVRTLQNNKVYWWRVCARFSDGWGMFSSTSQFRIAITGVSDQHGTPAQYALGQNYPNPFNPGTTIRYSLPHKSQVFLAVYNTLGQHVVTLVQDQAEAGSYEVKFDGSALASGVYFYRIQAGSFTQTKRLLLLR